MLLHQMLLEVNIGHFEDHPVEKALPTGKKRREKYRHMGKQPLRVYESVSELWIGGLMQN